MINETSYITSVVAVCLALGFRFQPVAGSWFAFETILHFADLKPLFHTKLKTLTSSSTFIHRFPVRFILQYSGKIPLKFKKTMKLLSYTKAPKRKPT